MNNFELPKLRQKFFSLTQTESAIAEFVRPDQYSDLKSLMALQMKMIAFGSGRSSCLASVSNSGISVDMSEFNRVLDFNPDENFIIVEAGMKIGELLQFLRSKGFWFAIQPCQSQMSLGSCLAYNVLGKSPYHTGVFGDYVQEFSLLHPRKGEMNVMRVHDLFALTLGGMGLTGIVLHMKLKIEKMTSRSVIRNRIALKNLDEAPELFDKLKDKCDAIYSWHNLNLKAEEFGRGYLYIEKWSDDQVATKFKSSTLNTNIGPLTKYLAPLFCDFINPLFERFEKMHGDQSKLDILKAAFAFEQPNLYYKACGARRFFQYQCIVPNDFWYIFIEKFSNLKWKWGIECTNARLQLAKGNGHLLNFLSDGICFSVDILNSPEVLSFLEECDELLLICKGLPNLTKDSRLSAEFAQKTYPEYLEFKEQLELYDESKTMNSNLRERLDV